MFFHTKELELRNVRFDVTFPPGEIEFFDPGLKQISPLKAEGSAELLSEALGDIRVRGHVSVTLESECDRCLETATYPVESDFDLFYRPAEPTSALRPAEEVEIHEGEVEIAFYTGSGLDLKDIMREYVLLSLPMQRVCAETCLGICPVCGQNRNTNQCRCEVKPADDRWAALKNLTTRGI